MAKIINPGGGGGGALADHTHNIDIADDGGPTINANSVTARVEAFLGEQGTSAGTLKFWDDDSMFGLVMNIPALGLTNDRAVTLPDIGGAVLMVGETAVTTSGGSPAAGTIAKVTIAARTTVITTTTITNTTPAGMYMLSAQLACTAAGGTGQIQLTYSAATRGGTRTASFARDLVLAGMSGDTRPIYLLSGNITFTTAFVGGGAAGTYATDIRCSYMG